MRLKHGEYCRTRDKQSPTANQNARLATADTNGASPQASLDIVGDTEDGQWKLIVVRPTRSWLDAVPTSNGILKTNKWLVISGFFRQKCSSLCIIIKRELRTERTWLRETTRLHANWMYHYTALVCLSGRVLMLTETQSVHRKVMNRFQKQWTLI